jgi:hypothetical protein
MSLFGAIKALNLGQSLKKAKKNFEDRMSSEIDSVVAMESSHIGGQLYQVAGKAPFSRDDGGVATTSEIAHKLSQLNWQDQLRGLYGTPEFEILKEQTEKERFETGSHRECIEDDLRRFEDSEATSSQESGWLHSDLDDMRLYSDRTGKTGVSGITRFACENKDGRMSSELSSPPLTTEYGRSIDAMPPSALPLDRFSTPRVSAGTIARKYIQAEDNTSQHAEREEGMEETRKVATPIPRTFDISDSSEDEDDAITEVD